MLVDEFLPVHDFVERHHLDILASPERVYAAVRTLNMSNSTIIRWLFLLRGLPTFLHPHDQLKQALGLTLEGLLKNGFILLGETPPQEILLGLVGRFWTATGGIARLDAAGFRNFNTPGYAKAAWNFFFSPLADGTTRLTTETRVQCLDETSRRYFRLYWLFIRPFSGLIRKAILRAIKRTVETTRGQSVNEFILTA
jgi:hypothetical protein